MADPKLAEILPFPSVCGTAGYNFSNMTLDASTDALEFVFQAPADDTITGVLIRQATETGDDTTVFRVSIQSVDGSGNPSGTILGATSNGYADYTATTAKDNSIQRLTLGESVDVTNGTWYALVIKYQSGTALPTNTVSFTGGLNHAGQFGRVLTNGYWINNNAGSRTRQVTSNPVFGLVSATTVYGCAVDAVGGTSYNSATAGADEYGVQFSIPAAWCDTYKLAGIYAYIDVPGVSTTLDITLWDNGSPPVSLATLSYDTDYEVSADSLWYRFLFTTGTLPTLTAGTTYNLTIFNNHGSTNMTMRYVDVDQNGDFAGFPWGALTMYEAKRLNAASSFTTTTTRRPGFGLVLSDITEPTGGATGGYVIGG